MFFPGESTFSQSPSAKTEVFLPSLKLLLHFTTLKCVSELCVSIVDLNICKSSAGYVLRYVRNAALARRAYGLSDGQTDLAHRKYKDWTWLEQRDLTKDKSPFFILISLSVGEYSGVALRIFLCTDDLRPSLLFAGFPLFGTWAIARKLNSREDKRGPFTYVLRKEGSKGSYTSVVCE